MLRHVILPTSEAVSLHMDTYRRLQAVGVPSYALAHMVVHQAMLQDSTDPVDGGDLGQCLLEHFAETMQLDINPIDVTLYDNMCAAANALYLAVLKFRGTLLCTTVKGDFVSGATFDRWCGDDVVVMLEVSSFGATYNERHAQ